MESEEPPSTTQYHHNWDLDCLDLACCLLFVSPKGSLRVHDNNKAALFPSSEANDHTWGLRNSPL